MKAKYFLVRNLCGTLQFSQESYTSLAKAEAVVKRQVNPSQWFIIVNPHIMINGRAVCMDEEEKRQRALLKTAFDAIKELAK